MKRRLFFLWLLASNLTANRAAAQMSHSLQPKPGIDHSINVPFVYEDKASKSFALQYELGRQFDPKKPTVFVIADGQQFYVRQDLVAPLQDELFGSQFNVVGIFGRGSNQAVKAEIRHGNATDWPRAYALLKSDEWVEDIESARKALLGPNGAVLLYGRSGGGLLVHQYLAKYPEHVRAVFTQAAVNRFVDAEFGLNSDTFWDEIGKYDARLQPQLLNLLARHAAERNRILLLLQRQNFFVAADQIQGKRARLIRILDQWDEAEIARLSKAYQVDAILATMADQDGASAVRVFELFAPVLAKPQTAASDRVDPDIEVGKMFAAPLVELLQENQISEPAMDLRALHQVRADVYMLAGRYDHTADYRSQIALASHYQNHRLLLLNDDHDFLQLGKTGLYPQLVQAALSLGIRGPASAGVESGLGSLIFDER